MSSSTTVVVPWVIVAVYTWNEWFEETYIEPSVNHGDQYLKQVRTYLNGWVQR